MPLKPSSSPLPPLDPQQGTISAATGLARAREQGQCGDCPHEPSTGLQGQSPQPSSCQGQDSGESDTLGTNLLLLQVDGVGPPLYPEDIGHRVLAHAEKKRKGELGTPALGKHVPVATRNAKGKSKGSALPLQLTVPSAHPAQPAPRRDLPAEVLLLRSHSQATALGP